VVPLVNDTVHCLIVQLFGVIDIIDPSVNVLLQVYDVGVPL
jgi:hypothetical protein